MARRDPGGDSPFAEAADQPATSARLIWNAADDASTLAVEVLGGAAPETVAIDLAALPLAVTVFRHAGGEQVTLSDGYRRIALTVTGGTLLAGPVRARFALNYEKDLARRIMTLRRLAAVLETGRLPKGLYPREPRSERWLLALRAFDAAASGASQREIAEILFAPLYSASGWKADAEFLRLRVNRLLRLARRMAAGDYRALLR
jgi:hypothetical protein